MGNCMIDVKINGTIETIEPSTTIAEVLESKDVRPEMVAVEINGELVPKGQYEKLPLAAGDKMEFLHYMAGGR